MFAHRGAAGQTRRYLSLGQAADENALSRMHAGYHFRDSWVKGQLLGSQPGAYVVQKALK